MEAFFACRLIPLDKNPWMRPIGIGDILRRIIIGKMVMRYCKNDIVNAAGDLQLCAGQKSACEAAVHSMENIFNDEDTDAVILV